MKRAFSLFAVAALLAGCASYDDDEYRGGTGTVWQEDTGSGTDATMPNTDLEPSPMPSSEQFPGQEPLPSEQRVPDDAELDEIDRNDSGTDVELKGDPIE